MIESMVCAGRVLEIGTGTGLVAIHCAKMGFETDASDKASQSLECASHNAELNGVKIRLIKSDLFTSIPDKYDTILFNPPYLPVEDSFEGSDAWNGGTDGLKVVREFLDNVRDHLNPGGNVFVILSDLTDVSGLMDEYRMFSFTLINTQKFEFESISCYRIRVW